MRTLSTLRWDSVHPKMLTLFTPEHIPVFRALLEIKIELRNTSLFLGLYSRSRSRSNSGTTLNSKKLKVFFLRNI